MPMPLYVLTCARPGGANYAAPLLRELSRQPWSGERNLWSDGPLPPETIEAAEGWRLQVGERQGPPNTWAFADLARDARRACCEGGAEGALFLEDDVVPCRGFLPYVEAIGCSSSSGVAYVSWFDAGLFRRRPEVGSLMLADAGEVVPAQARTISAWALTALIRRGAPQRPEAGLDAWMADVLSGSLMAFHSPSLVQHAGAVSAAVPGADLIGRRSESWPGYDFDAQRLLSLVPRMQRLLRSVT